MLRDFGAYSPKPTISNPELKDPISAVCSFLYQRLYRVKPKLVPAKSTSAVKAGQGATTHTRPVVDTPL